MFSLTGRRGWASAALQLALLLLLVAAAVFEGLVFRSPLSAALGTDFTYLGFVVLTVFVVRRVEVRPGRFLGSRWLRRGLATVALAVCCLLAATPEVWTTAYNALLLLVLLLLQVLLSRSTEQVTVSLPRHLDERQAPVRDRAFRLAYWLLAPVLVGVVLVCYFASAPTREWLGYAADGGPMIALVALLVMLPTGMLAWIEPDRVPGAPPSSRAQRTAVWIASGMVGLCVAAPILGALTFLAVPAHRTQVGSTVAMYDSRSHCGHFATSTSVGFWFTSAELPLDPAVCWNGQRARVQGAVGDQCDGYDANFVVLDGTQCRVTKALNGTVRVTETARFSPGFLPFLTRRIELSVAVDGQGRVVNSS